MTTTTTTTTTTFTTPSSTMSTSRISLSPITVAVHTTTYDSPSHIPRGLITLLKSYLPFSLPVLGHLLTARPVIGGPIDSTPPVTVFTSFPLKGMRESEFQGLAGRLWSVGTYSLGAGVIEGMESQKDDYARYFCSKEPSMESADLRSSQIEDNHVIEEHVRAWMAGWVPLLYHAHRNTPKPLSQIDLPLLLGSVSLRWVPLIKSEYVTEVGPCVKFLNYQSSPSSSRSGSTSPSSDSGSQWSGSSSRSIGPLLHSDIPRFIKTSKVSRTSGYVTSRLPYSKCVKVDGESAGWGMIHGDGSIGGMYIEPNFRRKGLAKAVVDELLTIKLSPEYLDEEEEEDCQLPGMFGWHNADVVIGNADGEGFFKGGDGWRAGWECAWVFFR